MPTRTIAVIGSGISGLSAAWLLAKTARVTLFEKQPRLGGHTHTVSADTPEGPVPVDTGFIVYNEGNYPNLTAFLAHLGVATAPSDMGFAVSVEGGRMEYCGRHFNGLFGQRRNLVNFRHWQLVSDILRFFRNCQEQVQELPETTTIGEFLTCYGYSDAFIEDHILPISAAIWSTPVRGMLDFPARTFITFFANHGLLRVADRPLWRTIRGGAASYIGKVLGDGDIEVRTNAGLAAVVRHIDGVDLVFSDGHRQRFADVVLACAPDEALALLADASAEERRLLGAFRFTENHAVLHTDCRFMPRRRHLWSSWNYLRSGCEDGARLSLTYWMNRLQPLATTTNLFVTLNPMHEFSPGTVQHEVSYRHPMLTADAIAAQRAMWEIQGTMRTWFAGAWLGYGFHEDGLQSGLEVAERLGGEMRPWRVDASRGRIAHNWEAEERPLLAAE